MFFFFLGGGVCLIFLISIDEVRSNHAEYAADSGVWSSDESIKVAAEVVNQDLVTEKKWCCKWNMLIAADKTEVVIFT